MLVVMVFLLLYSRYRSATLAALIMANIPLALIGAVIAMWLAGVTLSVATMVGFITLAGIATRNGILKVSHYINLCRFEGERFGEAMVVRGSLERLTPVLMTALTAAFALTPLLLAAENSPEPPRATSAPALPPAAAAPAVLAAAAPAAVAAAGAASAAVFGCIEFVNVVKSVGKYVMPCNHDLRCAVQLSIVSSRKVAVAVVL